MRFWWMDAPPSPERDITAAPTDKTQLGTHAERLLADPVLALVFEKIERDLTETWRRSAVKSSEERETAYRMLWCLEAVRSKLRVLAGDAKVIAFETKRKEAEERHKEQQRERALGIA